MPPAPIAAVFLARDDSHILQRAFRRSVPLAAIAPDADTPPALAHSARTAPAPSPPPESCPQCAAHRPGRELLPHDARTLAVVSLADHAPADTPSPGLPLLLTAADSAGRPLGDASLPHQASPPARACDRDALLVLLASSHSSCAG